MDPFVGEIRMFAFPQIPIGWLRCDGGLHDAGNPSYKWLFALLGKTFGGDGMTTFGVPDLRGRVPLHFGVTPEASYTFAEKGGQDTVALTLDQVPPHSHQVLASPMPGTQIAAAGGYVSATAADKFGIKPSLYATGNSRTPQTPLDPGTIAKAGGGGGHNNVQPSLTLVFCIAYTGIFPSKP